MKTSSPLAREARRMNVELILSNHPQDCLNCIRNQKCELQTLAEKLGIREQRFERRSRTKNNLDISSPSLVRDMEKCILCRRCVAVCQQVQGVSALGPINRGIDTIVAPVGGCELNSVACTLCGQCVHVCPVGAIYEKDDTQKVWSALADPTKHVVVQTAPAIRVAIGEEMGLEPGALVTGKLVAACGVWALQSV